MRVVTCTLAERPELAPEAERLSQAAWPEFLHHVDCGHLWPALGRNFAPFQLFLCDEGRVLACGHSVPLFWDGTAAGLPESWDAAIEHGVKGDPGGRAPNTLSALAAIVDPAHRGQGLSGTLLLAMRAIAARQGLGALIAPVRPTMKALYPLTPIESYARWVRPDGAPFDPWMRVHWRLGARVLRPVPCSTVVTGSVADWERWTGMAFPESGAYVVPGALSPVVIDRQRDTGRYEEPNVWMAHPLGPP